MIAYGVSCNLDKKRLHVEGVQADLDGDELTFTPDWSYTAPGIFSAQLGAIFKDANDVAKQCASAAVMIRSMDWYPRLNREIAHKRYAAEGVLIVAFSRHARSTRCESGADCAKLVGLKKADIVGRVGVAVGEDQVDAALAALAALADARPQWAARWVASDV